MVVPDGFRESFAADFGAEAYEALLKTLADVPSPVSIRRHPTKFSPLTPGAIPWCPEGLLLPERPTFGADPLWHAGAYYVQEPASMAVARYLAAIDFAPVVALDLCAAPGGKSTLLRSHLPDDCLLVTNEPDKKRAKVLEENILRWGAEETLVTSALPAALRSAGVKADMILVDAPCSGEGMFRKEPEAVTGWSLDLVDRCAKTQREILREAWEMLTDGGLLIYSTCTYNRAENEAQLSFLRDDYGAEVILLPELPQYGAEESDEERGLYRFFPHRTGSEGLTCFGVRKSGPRVAPEPVTRGHAGRAGAIPEELSDLPEEQLLCTPNGTGWRLLSPRGVSLLRLLEQAEGIRILRAGVDLGSVKGRDFIPDVSWVLSAPASDHLPYPQRAVTAAEAFALIGRQTIPSLGTKGYRVATYAGVPLTLIKDLGSRVNNLYPKGLALHDTRLTPSDMPHILDNQ